MPLKFESVIIIPQNSVVLEFVNLTPTFRCFEIACAVALIGCDLKINYSWINKKMLKTKLKSGEVKKKKKNVNLFSLTKSIG